MSTTDPQAAKDNNGLHPPNIPSTALATPAALALHNNFRTSVRALRRDLVRVIHYLTVIHERKIYRALGYANIRLFHLQGRLGTPPAPQAA